MIDDEGKINENLIFSKLKNKTNWISEIHIIKRSIPNKWLEILKREKRKINYTSRDKEITIYSCSLKELYNIKCINNKALYEVLLEKRITDNGLLSYWNKYFDSLSKEIMISAFKFITNHIVENEERMFRWKLLHHILPNGYLLNKWKIADTDLCLKCKEKEDYIHYFINCSENDLLWTLIKNFFHHIKYEIEIKTLFHIVFGYKVGNKSYNDINIVLSLIGFVIYKSYHRSERKSLYCNSIYMLKSEIAKKLLIKEYKDCLALKKLFAFLSY